VVGLVVVLSLAVAACGSDDGDTVDTVDAADAEATVATDAPTGSSEVADAVPETTSETAATSAETPVVDAPERVVSLSPTHTEMMFAIGAGDQLVAVDDFSNYPPEALELPHELSGFEPSVEAIASFEPDLVLIGGDFTGLGDQLASLDIESWDGPTAITLDDTYAQIEDLGVVTGHSAEATALVEQMRNDIDEIVAGVEVSDPPLTYYHELDPSLFSATSDTFIGQVYGLFDLRNVADELETDAGPFPRLNAEFLVSADPQMVFLADTKCCGETAVTVAARPGWESISAVKNGAVFEMDDDIASRWGPRVVDYLRSVADAVNEATGP
jgi:iron complex transport system substrate-binding protein